MQAIPERSAYLYAVLVAIALTLLIDARTNSTPPEFDGVLYVDMAVNGWFDDSLRWNPDLKAPFAYRPGMPLASRGVAELSDVSAEQGFAIVARFCALCLLVSIFMLARCFGADFRHALVTMVVLGLYWTHVKFPLFFPTLVDVSAYPLMVVAFWALMTRRRAMCLLLSCVGLAFKEFLAVPLILLWYDLGREYRHSGSMRHLASLAGAVVIGLSVVVVPRLVIPVAETFQYVDPLNDPSTLERLIDVPTYMRRNFNIAYVTAGYWLPTLLLLTWPRLKALWTDLRGFRENRGAGLVELMLLHVALVMLLTLYGGTNLFIFVSYAVPVQTVVLALVLRRGVHVAEAAYVVAAVAVYNKIALHIPLPRDGFDAYIDFYGGWSARVNMATGVRVGELAAFWIGAWCVRALVKRREAPTVSSSDRS